MKVSPSLGGGVAAVLVAGLAFWSVAIWKPGPAGLPEAAGGVSKPLLAEARKKAEDLQQGREEVRKKISALSVLQGEEGEHRVFVSTQLVYLPENPEPVQPLDRKTKTEDGIEVGWKIRFGLDPADPGLKDEDPDGDGFTNAEEFLAGTDPTRGEDSPAKESKLKSRSGDPVAMMVTFVEKSGGLLTLRFQVGSKRGEFRGKPGDSFWVMAGPSGVEVFSQEQKLMAAQEKARASGASSHAIPLLLVSYEEKVETVKDASAGGVEMEVDNSVVVLERKDAVAGPTSLRFSYPSRPRGVSWDIGDIRLAAPGSTRGELGPFRVGETFSYGGKEFAVMGREGRKIQLTSRSEADKPPFWVPLEAGTVPPLAKP